MSEEQNSHPLSHLDQKGNPNMVDVGQKANTQRSAWAQAKVHLNDEILNLIQGDEIYTKKGGVFQTAIIAGTMAAKKTSDLIPLCHPIGLSSCKFEIKINDNQEVVIDCRVKVNAQTGVEMEALTGASVAALTIYDMCKAMSHHIVIKEVRLMEKTGGKKDFERIDKA